MSYKNLVLDADGAIATLTVNRLAKLNALNAETLEELDSALSEIERSGSLRGLIVTGAGGKAFVAGADIAEVAAANPVQATAASAFGQRIFRRLELMSKPSVAAINGFALGGGLELALACTFRVASATAKLGQPEVKLGLVCGYGGTQRLPRLVGRGRALELLLTGEAIDAEEAWRIGLVNRVVPADQLLHAARSLLEKVLANGPVAVGLTMQCVDAGMSHGFDEGQRLESLAFGLVASTEDRREGTRAFLDKRAAVFPGN